MATRGARLAADHVLALNSIDLAFYGRRVLGKPIRSKAAQTVLDTWHDYHAHLNTRLPEPITEAQWGEWFAKGDELFLNLIQALAHATHHKFDRQQLRTGGYMPNAHGRIVEESNELRALALRIVRGESALKMDITNWPVDPAAVEQQKKWQGDMLSAIRDPTKSSTDEQA